MYSSGRSRRTCVKAPPLEWLLSSGLLSLDVEHLQLYLYEIPMGIGIEDQDGGFLSCGLLPLYGGGLGAVLSEANG